MTAIWRRRARLLVLVAAMTLVAAGCVSFTGTKVVTNGVSSGPFVVRITCEIGAQTVTEDLTFDDPEDLASPDGETQESDSFLLATSLGDAHCTITEIEQAGATSVTYECGDPVEVDTSTVEPSTIPGVEVNNGEDLGAGGPGMSVSRRGNEPITCTETPDGLEVDIALTEDTQYEIPFTVINDFTPTPTTPTTAPPTTTPPTTAAPTAAAPAPAPPVAAQPTFTG